MKRIFVLLVTAFSYIHVEAASNLLQPEHNDGYWQPSDYKNSVQSYLASKVEVTDDMGCEQQVTTDGIIQSPPYPVPLGESCRIYKWHIAVEGYNINVTIDYLDLDTTAGDYLIISPGSTLVKDEVSLVLTGSVTTAKTIQVVDHSEMLVMFVTQKGSREPRSTKGFQISYVASGDFTTETPTTTPEPTLPPAPPKVDYDISVYLSGIGPKEFYRNKVSTFKEAVVKMADIYCDSVDIERLEPTTSKNVKISRITECPRTWPDWETCTKLNLSVPIYTTGNYELARDNLRGMWNLYAKNVLSDTGLQPYQVPDAGGTFLIWLYIALGVAAIFTLLMISVWHLNLFNRNNKKGSSNFGIGRASTASTDSWISNSYQEVPPLTDLFYEESYDKPPNHEMPSTLTSSNMHTVPNNEKPRSSDEFGAAFLFSMNNGYDNQSFDISSEEPHQMSKAHVDDFSSDDESILGENTPKDTKKNHEHLYEAPKQVDFEDNNESAL